jgi:hypothetical protein
MAGVDKVICRVSCILIGISVLGFLYLIWDRLGVH